MPALPPRQHTRLKCISMGDEGVGNSCLIKRYCEEKLVYDVNERASFESLERWLKEAAEHGAKNPVYAVCANKADGGAAKRRAVGEAEGRKWAADRKMGYFETSAKDGDGVGALFESLFSQAMAR